MSKGSFAQGQTAHPRLNQLRLEALVRLQLTDAGNRRERKLVDSDGLSLRHLLDSAPDGFVVVNSDGGIVWANRTAHKLFGYRHAELIGKGIEDLVPERMRSGHAGFRLEYQESSRVRPMGLGLNLLGRKNDGSEFPVEISLSPLHTTEGLLVTAVVRDVTERRRLEDERNSLQLQLETERERDRIAMDLHDGIMQDIYAVALGLELALGEAEDKDSSDAIVERSIEQLRDIVLSIRSYIFDLRPREFSGSLAKALSDLAQEFRQNSQIETRALIGDEVKVGFETSVALYHIAHESLSNIQRHAGAKHVTVELRFDNVRGRLEISDDGVGFDPAISPPGQHRGMRNMAARARSIDATLNVDSSPGKGTRLSVVFPVISE